MVSKKLFILLITLPLAFSCSKDEGGRTVTNGLIQDITNEDLVAQANVYLERREKDCSNCVYELVESTKSNMNGGFNFNFDAGANTTYRVRAEKAGYYSNLATPSVVIKSGEGSTPVLWLQPEGYIRLLLKNTNPLNANDQISIVGGNTFVGATVDTTDVIIALGNQSNIVHWTVTRNSSPSSYSAPVQAIVFDTVNFAINY